MKKHFGNSTVLQPVSMSWQTGLYNVVFKLLQWNQQASIGSLCMSYLKKEGWIQQLHTYCLLNAPFRPAEESCVLRSYVRQRTMLIQSTTTHIQHMQKALMQMNLQLHHVLADITGKTGMRIIRAINDGERCSKTLASYRDHGCKNSVTTIEQRSVSGEMRQFLERTSSETIVPYLPPTVQN